MTAPEIVALVVATGATARGLEMVDIPDLVIAADGGLEVARAAGIRVDLVVGDMDSVDPVALAEAEAEGVAVERHPGDKDESDLELALAAALTRGATTVRVVVSAGGRLDHAVANLAVLTSPLWSAAELEAVVGESRAWVVRGRRTLPLVAGDHVALLPIGGDALGVSTEGLAYPLSDERLDAHGARGIANEVLTNRPSVIVSKGVLLVVSSSA
jgi:thiamine pyrophosphokinase